MYTVRPGAAQQLLHAPLVTLLRTRCAIRALSLLLASLSCSELSLVAASSRLCARCRSLCRDDCN